jgi:acyl carrier protein
VLAPKIDGSRILAEWFAERAPDFIVFCSSLASLVGLPGQVDYTAANAYQDALATSLRRRSGVPALSINWDAWRESGMAVETELPAGMEQQRNVHLAAGMTDDEGRRAFARALNSGLPRIAVSPRVIRANEERDVPRESLEDSSREEASVHARPDLDAVYEEPRDSLEERIASVWETLLGIDRVGRDDDFIELGGHSVLALQLVSRLNEELGVSILMTDLFQYPTVASLAKRVGQQQTVSEDQMLGELLDLVEQMPEDESDRLEISGGGGT